MNSTTRKRIQAAGGRVTTVQEFLGLSDAEMAIIDMKIALAKLLREQRKSAALTQEQAAKLVGSSQSRVAKMEAGDPAVSLDLLVGSLLRLGASPERVGKVIKGVPAARKRGRRSDARPASRVRRFAPESRQA